MAAIGTGTAAPVASNTSVPGGLHGWCQRAEWKGEPRGVEKGEEHSCLDQLPLALSPLALPAASRMQAEHTGPASEWGTPAPGWPAVLTAPHRGQRARAVSRELL